MRHGFCRIYIPPLRRYSMQIFISGASICMQSTGCDGEPDILFGPPQSAQSRHARNASKLFCHGCALSPSPRPIRTTLHCDFEDPSPLLLSGAGSESRISNTSRTAWMIFDDPSTKTRMPLRRWISKSVGQGSEADSAKGRVESQSTERSQASTLGILSTERGGIVMGMVDIA